MYSNRYQSRLADRGSCCKDGQKLYDYQFVMDQGKTVFCTAEISITLLNPFTPKGSPFD